MNSLKLGEKKNRLLEFKLEVKKVREKEVRLESEHKSAPPSPQWGKRCIPSFLHAFFLLATRARLHAAKKRCRSIQANKKKKLTL
jgi:hypothetical protein